MENEINIVVSVCLGVAKKLLDKLMLQFGDHGNNSGTKYACYL